MWMKVLLFVGALLSVAYAIFVYVDGDRTTRLARTPLDTLVQRYGTVVPRAKRRVVAIAKGSIDERTLKSLLDQSVRLHDIAIETTLPPSAFARYSDVVSVHGVNTGAVRERESDTLVIQVTNGRVYPYDYVERATTKYA